MAPTFPPHVDERWTQATIITRHVCEDNHGLDGPGGVIYSCLEIEGDGYLPSVTT